MAFSYCGARVAVKKLVLRGEFTLESETEGHVDSARSVPIRIFFALFPGGHWPRPALQCLWISRF